MVKAARVNGIVYSLLILIVITFGACKSDLIKTIEEEVSNAVSPPAYTSTFPADGAEAVEVDINAITIDFDKILDSKTVIVGTTVIITDGSGAALSVTKTVDEQNISLKPNVNLAYSETYTVNVTSGIKDTDGNPLGEAFEWSFSTTYDPASDRTPPTISNFIINGGEGSTNSDAITISLYAEDNDGKEGLKYMIRMEGAEWPAEWTVLTSEGLVTDVAATLVVELGNTQIVEARILDSSGNESSVYQQSILYEDSPPQILSVTPSGTSVPGNTAVSTVIFNEEMSPISISTDSFYVEDSSGAKEEIMGNVSLSFKENNGIPNSLIELAGIRLEQFETYYIVIKNRANEQDTMKDIAGNSLEEEKRYSFATSSAVDNTPPEVELSIDSLIGATDEMFLELENGIEATNWNNLLLSVTAKDDFNSTKDMKIWDGATAEPAVYTSFADTFAIDIDSDASGSGLKYIYYKVRDWANNENEGYIQIILDQVAPELSFSINDDATHTTDSAGGVNLAITASDVLPGELKMTGVTHLAISNDDTDFDEDDDGEDDWIELVSEMAGWSLSELNGSKTVYIKAKDLLGQECVPVSKSIIWDNEAPSINITSENYLEVNTGTQQLATIADNVDGAPSILWAKASGPGTLSFSDIATAQPTITAVTDGEYTVSVTVTDGAGNSSNMTIPFIWDTTAPSDTLAVTTPQYNNDGKPEWVWMEVEGASVYKCTFTDPPDWNDPGTYNTVSNTRFIADTDLADGENTLFVSAWDKAGNMAPTIKSATSFVDTLAPTIYGDGQLFLTNTNKTLDFTDEIDGDGNVIDTGSEISTILWDQESGSEITFVDADTDTPNLSVAPSVVPLGSRDVFGFRVTVTDKAGNTNTASFTLDWDKEPPVAPTVTGLERTPNKQPTWSWQTSGGGNGIYQFTMKLANGGDALNITNEVIYDTDTTLAAGTTSFSPLGDGEELKPDVEDIGDPADEYHYVLFVKERDDAGNWSEPGTHTIWVDSNYAAPPEVTVVGNALTTDPLISWNWSSGALQTAGTTLYRYRINGGSWLPSDAGATINSLLDWDSATVSGEDNLFTIEVQEKNMSSDLYFTEDGAPKLGSHTVRVDLQGPSSPTVSSLERTRDTTPTWSWSSTAGSDGKGIFRYRLDSGAWSSETTNMAYTPTAALSAVGSGEDHTLEVQEQDSLGNWSNSGESTVTIDIMPPTLTSVLIVAGEDSSTEVPYTNSSTVWVKTDAPTEPGLQMSAYDHVNSTPFDWQDFKQWTEVPIKTFEDDQYVHIRLMDDVGNISSWQYDTVKYDITPPSNLSFILNGGNNYTPSKDAKFNANAMDNFSSVNEIQVQHAYYYDGSYHTSTWEPIGDNRYFDFFFTNSTGWKSVYARFRDAAGNVTAENVPVENIPPPGWLGDSVYMKLVTMRYAWKGYNTEGSVNVYFFQSYTNAEGYNTFYRVYSTTDKSANPNNGASVDYEGVFYHVAGTSYGNLEVDVPQGEIRYFWVIPYNGDLGGWGYFSPTGVMGFSSNVTIIYDDQDATDEAKALYMEELLEDTYYDGGIINGADIAGEMPDFSVTLLPESEIHDTSYGYYYYIYGTPTILTPGTDFTWDDDEFDYKLRNILYGNRGLIGFGREGMEYISRVDLKWGDWNLQGTRPNAIGWAATGTDGTNLGASTSSKKLRAVDSDSIWDSPVSNVYLTSSYSNSSLVLGIFSSNVQRHGAYLPDTGILGEDGMVYARAVNSLDYEYYPVVRQGRFLQIGYEDVPGRNKTSRHYEYGQPFFINLVERMSQY